MERKEMFYLTTQSTQFNLRLYGFGRVVKDHSARRKLAAVNTWAIFVPILQKGIFYMHHPTGRTAHATAFDTPVVEHCLEREIAQWVHSMRARTYDP